MKFNKWTLGLAAVGVVSMASAVRADETKLSALNTAVSSTVISGYVDVAAQYNAGSPSPRESAYAAYQPTTGYNGAAVNNGKVDNFSLNDVVISLDKALDESPWASGYHVDLNWGADAISPANGTPVRQAYVTLRTPVGNGIDWKVGGFDGVTGYEGNTAYSNPNYTRSYGYEVNPASELGMIGSYKIVDGVSVQAGLGNRYSGNSVGLSSKDFIFAAALTAPDSWGWIKGSTLNAGTVQTFDNGGINNYSVSATIATPVTGLKFGAAYDIVQSLQSSKDGNIFGVYGTYQATDKLAFNVRGEYVDTTDLPLINGYNQFGFTNHKGEEVTATVEYDLWANVVSRVEFRWDHTEHGVAFNNGGFSETPSNENAFLLALNLVYKF
jgi:hypothetical protein